MCLKEKNSSSGVMTDTATVQSCDASGFFLFILLLRRDS